MTFMATGYSLFELVLSLFSRDRADKLYYKRQYETLLNVVIPEMDRDARDSIRRLEDEKRQAIVAFREISERYDSLLATDMKLLQEIERLAHETGIDPLTSLLNRRGMMKALHQVVTREQRLFQKPPLSLPVPTFSVLFVDVDNFKAVNERFGHVVADELLQALACVMGKFFRATDLLHRYGGDEFVVFMSDIGKEQALERAEEFLKAVYRITHPALRDGRITVSVGISTIDVKGSDRSDEIYSAYRRALEIANASALKAKTQGRNQVCQ